MGKPVLCTRTYANASQTQTTTMSELAYAMTPPTREERSASIDSAQSDVDNVLKVASALREFNTLRQEGIVSEQEFLEMKAKLLAVGKDELGRSPSGDTLETLVEATNEMDSSRASRISFADDGGGDLVSNQKELDQANDAALDNTIAVVQGTWGDQAEPRRDRAGDRRH